MTVERASEIVRALKESNPYPDTKSINLMEHFINFFRLPSLGDIESFADMCGYENARKVVRVDPGGH
jgi:hypothetical protein